MPKNSITDIYHLHEVLDSVCWWAPYLNIPEKMKPYAKSIRDAEALLTRLNELMAEDGIELEISLVSTRKKPNA